VKVDPVREARSLAAHHVSVVHVTRGCTALVKDLGRLAPKTKEERVVERRKRDRRGAIQWDAGAFFVRVTVDAPVIQAIDLRVRKSVLPNGFGGGVVLVTGAADAAVEDVAASFVASVLFPSFMSFLIPRTDHAVVKSVKRNPPIMTETSLSTSYASPNPLANGNRTKLGTKNTGNHFANSIAPGFKALYSPAPHFSLLTASINNMEAKSVPHPAKLDGNGMEYFRKVDRNFMSRKMRMVVARMICRLPMVDGGGGDDDDVAVAERALSLRFEACLLFDE